VKTRLTASITPVLAQAPKGSFGVAVSGGGDSVALLHLLYAWGFKNGRKIYVATVNHNLRKEAREEAGFVADLCQNLNLNHSILSWENWDGKGNLQNEARNARKSLLRGWACDLGLSAVALGHTEDDQAETFLMRLARGSGVDGLSGMQAVSGDNPVWIRPMLDISRSDLRDYLTGIGQGWIEDPSNKSEKFDRVKFRNAMPALAELGLTARRLASTAKGLQPARAALEQMTLKAAHHSCRLDKFGTVALDLEVLQAQPMDIQYRVLSHAVGWVTGTVYRPRFSALKSVYDLLRQGKSQTLAGCYIKVVSSKQVIVMRELANMASTPVSAGCFDRRWRVIADPCVMDADIRALGADGLIQLKDWRNLGVKRDILLQAPAAWQGNVVISAPLAGFDGPVRFDLKIDAVQFFLGIVSH